MVLGALPVSGRIGKTSLNRAPTPQPSLRNSPQKETRHPGYPKSQQLETVAGPSFLEPLIENCFGTFFYGNSPIQLIIDIYWDSIQAKSGEKGAILAVPYHCFTASL